MENQCDQLMALRKSWLDLVCGRLLQSDLEFLESQDLKKMQMKGGRGPQSKAEASAGRCLHRSCQGKLTDSVGILHKRATELSSD